MPEIEPMTDRLARAIGAKSVEPCAPEVAQRHSGYQVGGKSFVYFRTPQADAADPDTYSGRYP